MGRGEELAETLRDGDSLLVVCHDNPDPDCLASALALQYIAEEVGLGTVTITYGGSLSHQQNRALVNLLDIDLERFSESLLSAHDRIGFVDHSIPGRHNSVPKDAHVDVIVDHHPLAAEASATFVDERREYGATATIFVEYLQELDFGMSARLASALLFAIHRERLDFMRWPTYHEYEAGRILCPDVDLSITDRLYGAAFSQATLDAIGEAIRTREIRGSSLVASVGRTTERDALVQAADYLLNVEGVNTTLVFGIVDGEIQISARSIDPGLDVGATLERAYGDVGSAGGHVRMAGAQISLGLFGEISDEADETLVEYVSDRIEQRFFEAVDRQRGEG